VAGTTGVRTAPIAHGSGPSADDTPGGLGREVDVGILLPETGDLASVGKTMIQAAEIPAKQPVVNYSELDSQVQPRFKKALETGDEIRLPQKPSNFSGGYVYYQDDYYETYVPVGDAAQTEMFFSMVGGSLLVLIGLGAGYYVIKSKSK